MPSEEPDSDEDRSSDDEEGTLSRSELESNITERSNEYFGGNTIKVIVGGEKHIINVGDDGPKGYLPTFSESGIKSLVNRLIVLVLSVALVIAVWRIGSLVELVRLLANL